MWIKNIRLIDAYTDRIGNVEIQDGKIKTITDQKPLSITDRKIDGRGKILFPGFIDPHVHFRDPGFTHKEDFFTGTRSAIAGGVTTIFDMPNTKPATFTREILEEKRLIARAKAQCHWGLYFGAGIGNIQEIENMKNVPGVKLYLNTTTGNLKMDDKNQWREIFRVGKRVSLHAEGDTFAHAVEIWLEEGAPCPLHLCHASLKSEVDLVRELKKDRALVSKISMEACPHHLLMTHKELEAYGAYCCMKPVLATQEDVEALWKGVEDETIDFFATDHAPHTKTEKENSNQTGIPVYGIPGVETLFPLIFTQWIERGWDLKKFAAMMSQKAVKIFSIKDKKGAIKEGFDADLVIIDPEYHGKIEAKNLHSKCGWSSYEGWDIVGRVEKTIVGGAVVFENENFFERLLAREINFS
jgi:dihydroorotase